MWERTNANKSKTCSVQLQLHFSLLTFPPFKSNKHQLNQMIRRPKSHSMSNHSKSSQSKPNHQRAVDNIKINVTPAVTMNAAWTAAWARAGLVRTRQEAMPGPVPSNNRSLTSCILSMQSTVARRPPVPLKTTRDRTVALTLSPLKAASAFTKSTIPSRTTTVQARRRLAALPTRSKRSLWKTTCHARSTCPAFATTGVDFRRGPPDLTKFSY